jgi:glycosyltransferase involved in cell wall biosynthesis
MRILHVVPTYLPAVRYGGPIFAVHGLCRALVSRGHEIEVLTTNVNGRANSVVPLGVPVDLDGVQVKYFSSKCLRRLSWAPSLAHALKHDISRFDVVHLHSVFLWPTWAAARAAMKANVPYLISPRGMLVKELIGRRNRIVKSAWLRLIEKSNVEHAAVVHVTSELEATELQRFNWRLPKVVNISNGVDEPEATKDGSELSEDIKAFADGQPLVLYFGRLSWKKGLDRLLKAFALTRFGLLVIAGTDDENLVPRLQQLAAELQIADRVKFLPRTILGCDKEYLFAASRLFVLASYSENFGNAVLEAMRRAVPVVVTPEVGAAEIVRKAGGGFVTPGDPKPLSEAISRLLENSVLARTVGEAGQRYVQEHYGWPRVAAEMEELYESVRSPGSVLNKITY